MIGKTALREVKEVLLGVAEGAKVVLGAVLPKPHLTKPSDESKDRQKK
jgi:hypothetical protein